MDTICISGYGENMQTYVGVSKNRGTPKLMVYNGKPYQHSLFGGTSIYSWKHPCANMFFGDSRPFSFQGGSSHKPSPIVQWHHPKQLPQAALSPESVFVRGSHYPNIYRYYNICIYSFQEPKWPCFGGLTFKKRGQLGSTYICRSSSTSRMPFLNISRINEGSRCFKDKDHCSDY